MLGHAACIYNDSTSHLLCRGVQSHSRCAAHPGLRQTDGGLKDRQASAAERVKQGSRDLPVQAVLHCTPYLQSNHLVSQPGCVSMCVCVRACGYPAARSIPLPTLRDFQNNKPSSPVAKVGVLRSPFSKVKSWRPKLSRRRLDFSTLHPSVTDCAAG